MNTTDTYAALAAPFDQTHKDTRGGVELEYITGEQCVSRLNEVLGVAGWSFEVVEHGFNAEADEYWCLGRLTAQIEGTTVTRQQFGSQKQKRSRAQGTPLDIGFDMKGAATDALKKCASLIGVGLYLSHKEARGGNGTASNVRQMPPRQGAQQAPQQRAPREQGDVPPADGGLVCDVCHDPLTETKFKDGSTWQPYQLANAGRRKFNGTFCMTHYREAKAFAEQAAGASGQESPF